MENSNNEEHRQRCKGSIGVWPPLDKDRCSCCMRTIHHGYENVMEIKGSKQAHYNLDGKLLGVDDVARPIVALVHARCLELHHNPAGNKLECEKCGIFSVARKLQDGSSIYDRCSCACHRGQKVCSLLILPGEIK